MSYFVPPMMDALGRVIQAGGLKAPPLDEAHAKAFRVKGFYVKFRGSSHAHHPDTLTLRRNMLETQWVVRFRFSEDGTCCIEDATTPVQHLRTLVNETDRQRVMQEFDELLILRKWHRLGRLPKFTVRDMFLLILGPEAEYGQQAA